MIGSDGIDGLCERIAGLLARSADPRVLVGIAGAPGAGKTTLAAQLTGALGPVAVHVPMDGFHLADVALERLGLRDRKGAPETFDAPGYAALLGRLVSGAAVWAPAFDRDVEQPVAGSIEVPESARIVISEGNYLLLADPPWPAVRCCFDQIWFVRTEEALRRERLIARHVEFGKSRVEAESWVARVDDPNARLVEASADHADLVIDLGGTASSPVPS